MDLDLLPYITSNQHLDKAQRIDRSAFKKAMIDVRLSDEPTRHGCTSNHPS